MDKCVAIVPIKFSSRRLPNKNFLSLKNQPLCWYIFDTLRKCEKIEQVYCYCSEGNILSLLPDGVKLLLRDPRLDGDNIKANELFEYAVRRVDADIIALCQAPSPFTKPGTIDNCVEAITNEGYDCAFTVKKIQKYCWKANKPLNYNTEDMAQTQDLEPVFEETSGVYAFRKKEYLESNTRIHGNSKMIEVDIKEAIDIDNEEEFMLANHLYDFDVTSSLSQKTSNYQQLMSRISDENLPPLSQINHIAYDLDGVIINSLPTMERAWESTKEIFKIESSFIEYKKYLGMGFKDILKKLGIEENMHEAIKAHYFKVSMENIELTSLYEGTKESLTNLKNNGFILSLVTSKAKNLTMKIIEKFHLSEIFDTIITPEDIITKRTKPNPDSLLQAALISQTTPRQSLYLGDMESDRVAARKAGYNFALASWGYGLPDDPSSILWFSSHNDLSSYFISSKAESN
ncbi:HAD hydrolase-like protein [Synechococcus sp. HIMB2401]|uniref:HAD hydrolase-like protein n=1 Tax=Synechococcus sp. HIMB2401 TaxID=3144208 RepID=UPI0036F270EA